jgi:restriction system protein
MTEMIAGGFCLALVAYLIYHAGEPERRRRLDADIAAAEAKRQEAELASDLADLAIAIKSRIRPEHLPVLMRKYRQTVREDEYGQWIFEDWWREVDYFLDRVLTGGIDLDAALGQGSRSLNRTWVLPSGSYRPYAIDVVTDIVQAALQKQLDEGHQVEFANSMSGADFERFCADELMRAGWRVQLIGASGDQGGDLIAEKDGLRVMIQCKKYSSPIGNTAVQEAFAGMRHHEASAACVVSNARYTTGARQLAASTGVYLLHYSQLCEFDSVVTA